MKNNRRKRVSLAISLALGGWVAIGGAPLYAEADPDPKPDQASQNQSEGEERQQLETVVATATRINLPGLIANSPIQTYTEREITRAQPAAIEDFIRLLPSAVPAIGPATNNGSDGGAQVDLRGLGPNRTLVLVDGRRLVPYNLGGVVDTNTVPMALIDRVDLVTGGASAVYGADAITGVVNFILKRNFEGIDLRAQYGAAKSNSAARERADVTFGSNLADNRGNVTVSVGYTKTDALLQGEREIGLVSRSSTTGNVQGSGTTVPAVFFGPDALFGQINPSTGSIGSITNTFNFNPLNYYQTPLDRVQATGLAHFTLNDWAEAYTQIMYTRSDVGTQLAPSGTFFNDYFVPVGNPLIPQPARLQMCADIGVPAAQCVVGNPTEILLSIGRRITELGPRIQDFETKTFQGTFGFRGNLSPTWRYDVYWAHGESDQLNRLTNWGSNSRVQQALRSIAPGVCTDPSNGCVPLNVFGPEGSITRQMLDFINLSTLGTDKVRQTVYAGTLSGDLGEGLMVPSAAYPIGVALGAEYRRIEAGADSDQASQVPGEVLGTGAPDPNFSGSFNLTELYGEFVVPLVNDRPWAYSLSLEAAYRHTEFEAGSTDSYGTWKYGGEWAPIETLRFRALAQRATRAPNVGELFSPQITGLDNLAVDPCEGNRINQAQANTPGTLSNLCRLTGVPLARIGSLPPPSAGQINVLVGGNPDLGPEVANTFTTGVVWSPLSDLTLTLDYYRIKLSDTISSPSVDDVLADCYDPARNPGFTFNAACALIGRNPNNGTFNGVAARGVALISSNLGKVRTSGLDLSAMYTWSLGDWGDLAFNLNLNHVLEAKSQPTPSAIVRECVGYYSISCGNIVYDYKSNFSTTWSYQDYTAGLTWRYLHSVEEEPGGTNFLPAYSRIGSYSYFDLFGSWQITENVGVDLSVTNLFDKEAPFVGNTIGTTSVNSGNTFPNYYDVIGRFYSLSARVKF